MFFAILSPKRTTSFSVRFSLFDCPFLEHVSFNMFVCISLFSCCLESRYSHQQMYLQSQQVCPKLSVPILSFFLFLFFFLIFSFIFIFFSQVVFFFERAWFFSFSQVYFLSSYCYVFINILMLWRNRFTVTQCVLLTIHSSGLFKIIFIIKFFYSNSLLVKYFHYFSKFQQYLLF